MTPTTNIKNTLTQIKIYKYTKTKINAFANCNLYIKKNIPNFIWSHFSNGYIFNKIKDRNNKSIA